jgi:hypothetical protein
MQLSFVALLGAHSGQLHLAVFVAGWVGMLAAQVRALRAAERG